jgi:ribonuclease BN (tRNA processing enzyme)
MPEVSARFIGSGDAFGSGGRLQTCILIDAPDIRFAIDFGTTSLVGLRQQGIDPNSIDVILLTHLHGDHCGGVPFFVLDAMLGSKRTTPLTILGPGDVETRLQNIQEALFRGSRAMAPKFALEYREVAPGETIAVRNLSVTAAGARHTKETNPLALRVQVANKSLAYTGDGELTDALVRLVAGVDLCIAECYFFSKSVKWHLNYADISKLSAKQIILTHMHEDMLQHIQEVPYKCAYDGFEIRC